MMAEMGSGCQRDEVVQLAASDRLLIWAPVAGKVQRCVDSTGDRARIFTIRN
jgi:hypothetical protein